MTIYSDKLLPGSPTGSTGDKNSKKYNTTRLVQSSFDENEWTMQLYYGGVGASHPYDTRAKLNGINAVEKSANYQANLKVWHVELSYATSTEEDIAPWLKPWKIVDDEEDTEIEITRDINGKVIQNTAYDLFLDRILKADSTPTVTITKNYQTYDRTVEYKLKKVINKKPFLDFPKKTLQKQKTSAEQVIDDKWGPYYTVTRIFKYQPDWKLKLDNVGLRELHTVTIDGEEVPRLFDIVHNGQPITTPVALDENGKEMAVGEGRKPIVLEWDIFNTYDFNKWYS